jgi:phage FluMu gp28-like protein
MFRKIYEASNQVPRTERTEDSKSYMTLDNGSRIVCLCGHESAIRGYTAPDMVIIDEASRAPSELYVAIRPMLAMSRGQLILISTPHGKQGFFYDVWCNHDEIDANDRDSWRNIKDGWERYKQRADENPRIDKQWLDDERLNLPGERAYRQEYGCEFVETEEQVFPYELIKNMFTDEIDPLFDGIISDVEPMGF